MAMIKGGHLVGKYLKEVEKVDMVFGISGGHLESILDSFTEYKIRAIDVRHEQAAAMMLKGMTAAFLLLRTCKVKAGDVILFHAAAGGVGSIFGQWAKHLGATVIGTVGSAEKAAEAKARAFVGSDPGTLAARAGEEASARAKRARLK